MKDKLTLSIEEDIIEFAHRLSEETNQSISSIVEKHLLELKEIKEQDYEVDPRVKKLSGLFEGEDFPESKEEMRSLFHEKNNS